MVGVTILIENQQQNYETVMAMIHNGYSYYYINNDNNSIDYNKYKSICWNKKGEMNTNTKELELGMIYIYIYIYLYIWGMYTIISRAFNNILISVSSNEKCVVNYDASASLLVQREDLHIQPTYIQYTYIHTIPVPIKHQLHTNLVSITYQPLTYWYIIKPSTTYRYKHNCIKNEKWKMKIVLFLIYYFSQNH